MKTILCVKDVFFAGVLVNARGKEYEAIEHDPYDCEDAAIDIMNEEGEYTSYGQNDLLNMCANFAPLNESGAVSKKWVDRGFAKDKEVFSIVLSRGTYE